jgi:small subunit ribosomal protein S16
MVKIRLSRHGAKKRPFYQIVVTDSRSPRDGRSIENIGYFNPIASGQDIRLHIDEARAKYWVSTGAQMSSRVSKLLQDFQKTQSEQTTVAA